jgi:hypothetical protein
MTRASLPLIGSLAALTLLWVAPALADETGARADAEAVPAPAAIPWRPGQAVTHDEKAEQRRNEEIAAVRHVLSRQHDPDVRAQLYFRLGELWWEKAQYVHGEEMRLFERAHQQWFECRTGRASKT